MNATQPNSQRTSRINNNPKRNFTLLGEPIESTQEINSIKHDNIVWSQTLWAWSIWTSLVEW